MAAPLNLNTTARDVLGLVAAQLDGSEVASTISTSRSIQAGFAPVLQRNLALQRSQWELLFPGQLTDNYSANEALLERFGLRTLILTSEEQAAWEAAKRSLIEPPPILAPEQEDALLAKHAPSYHRIIHLSPEQIKELNGYDDYNHLSDLAAASYRRIPSGVTACITNYSYRASNITLAVLMEGSLLDFLTVFAQDGKRYHHPKNGYNLAESTSEYLRRTDNQKRGINRYALIMSLILTGSPSISSYAPLYNCGYGKVAAQALLVAGYDFFFLEGGSFPARLSAFAEHSPETLTLILDWGLATRGSTEIPLPALQVIFGASKWNRSLDRHLEVRRKEYPDLTAAMQSCY